MSAETIRWLNVGHIFGFVVWTGMLLAVMHALSAHARASDAARPALVELERRLALAMDIGATVAILFGVLKIVGPPAGTAIFKNGGYMHMKLTAVVVLIGLHGFVRARVGKLRRGQPAPIPSWLVPAAHLLVLAIIIFVVVKPTAKW
jgi:putative membrane protein